MKKIKRIKMKIHNLQSSCESGTYKSADKIQMKGGII